MYAKSVYLYNNFNKNAMQNTQELKQFVIENCKNYPDLKEQIVDLYWLCLTEISEGGSEISEVHRCVNDIEEIIEESKN